MLARTSTLRHKASGVTLRTPLLIPSFSSKGFAVSAGASEVGKLFELSASFVTRICLVSAFDIAKQHLPPPDKFPVKPELLIVDSGGYEVSDDHDLSATKREAPMDRQWDDNMLRAVLDVWPDEMPAMFVSNDDPRHPVSLEDQLARARSLFKGRRQHLHTFLIKPETPTQLTLRESLAKLNADIHLIASFDAIGVTEKDLGRSILDRMEQIARLRRCMDEAQIPAPIHVFGALDPLTACLYFIAGAEMFDGLTWLRYAYDASGACVYRNNYGLTEFGPHQKDDVIFARTLSANYYYLERLEEDLRVYVSNNEDFSRLPQRDKLKEAQDQLLARLNSKKGGI